MIRLLILALLIFLGYTLWTAIRRSLPGGPRPTERRPDSSRRGEDMVQDPECGTFVPRSEALEGVIGGRRHFFCSSACRDAFKQSH